MTHESQSGMKPFTRKKMPLRHIVLYLSCTAIVLFLLIPTLLIIPMSFGSEKYLQFPPSSLSFKWYKHYFQDQEWVRSTLFSLRVAFLTTLVSTGIGTMAALALVRGQLPGRGWFHALVIAPLIIPVIIIAVSMFSVFLRLNLEGSLLGFVLAHSVLAVPYVVIVVSAALHRFDPNLELAALGLGASRLKAILLITLPMVMPGVITGAAFAFITSFDESIVSFFISGVDAVTLPKKIFNNVDFDVTPTVAVAGTVLTLVSLLLMGGIEMYRHKSKSKLK